MMVQLSREKDIQVAILSNPNRKCVPDDGARWIADPGSLPAIFTGGDRAIY